MIKEELFSLGVFLISFEGSNDDLNKILAPHKFLIPENEQVLEHIFEIQLYLEISESF